MIIKTDKTVSVRAEYSPTFVTAARSIGGKWDEYMHTWNFPLASEPLVRQICINNYMTDWSSNETCTLRVDFDLWPWHMGDALLIGPVLVAKKWGRDRSPVLSPQTVVVNGGFEPLGGSTKYPAIRVAPGTVIHIVNFPKDAADRLISEQPKPYSIVE